LVTGHICNWEMMGYSLAVLGYPIHAIARPLDNELVSRWVFGIREKRGLCILDKDQASGRAHALLAAGKPVGVVADQNAGPKQGCFVPFLGRLASTHKSVALLAATANVPIICGAAIRQPAGAGGPQLRHRLETTDIIHPEDWATQEDPIFYITARWAKAVETSVEAHPGQYLWMHRRWKTRPKFEEEGKPMPAALRRKLEALPWMTQEKMARLLGSGGSCA
jgi:KDO2-lipid IV(A) lauroyltransferase